jgi:hypothetical protein
MRGTKSTESGSAFPPGVAGPARRALASAGIVELADLTRFTEAQLRALHGVGPKALEALEVALREHGKALKSE